MMFVSIPHTRLLFVENDPGIPSGSSHDAFAGLSLHESKAIGTAELKANVGERDYVLRTIPPYRVRDAISLGSRNIGRVLNAVYEAHRRGLTEIIDTWRVSGGTRANARINSAKLFRESYERIREIARQASGMEQLGADATLYSEEEKWFRTAVREEIGYFHSFMEDIRAGNTDIARRIDTYVRALRFMYESARIQAMPDNVLLYWTGPRKHEDDAVCEGCEFMMERSPFPKDTIPAVPRDGSTQCLTNCRHRVLVRVVENLNEVVRRRQQLTKRSSMVGQLKELKTTSGLGRRVPSRTGVAKDPFRGTPLTRHVAPPRRRRPPR